MYLFSLKNFQNSVQKYFLETFFMDNFVSNHFWKIQIFELKKKKIITPSVTLLPAKISTPVCLYVWAIIFFLISPRFFNRIFLHISCPYPQTVWVPSPTWGNHVPIFGHVGMAVKQYRYYDAKTCGFDFDGAMQDFKDLEPGALLRSFLELIHFCPPFQHLLSERLRLSA